MVLHEPDNPTIDHIPGNFEMSSQQYLRVSKGLFLRRVYAWVEKPGAMAVIQEKFRSRTSGSWFQKIGCCVYV